MKSFRSTVFLVFFAYGALVAGYPIHAEAGEVRWVFMGFTKYRDALYIEMNSVSYPSHAVVNVWSLIAPSKKSKYLREVKRELHAVNKSADGFWCVEVWNEIDCQNGSIRHLQIVYFNRDGQSIHTATASDIEWKAISSGSLWDTLRKTVCKN